MKNDIEPLLQKNIKQSILKIHEICKQYQRIKQGNSLMTFEWKL